MQFAIKQFIKFYTDKSTKIALLFLLLDEYNLKKKLVQKTITKYTTASLILPLILIALENLKARKEDDFGRIHLSALFTHKLHNILSVLKIINDVYDLKVWHLLVNKRVKLIKQVI
jgi:hypothetical protein